MRVAQRVVRHPSDARAVCMASMAPGMLGFLAMMVIVVVIVVIRAEEGVDVVTSGVTVRRDARARQGSAQRERGEHERDDGLAAEHAERSYDRFAARK